MAEGIFFEITIVILMATIVSIAMRILRQPLIIGYIFTGIIAGPMFLGLVESSELLSTLAQIGVAFLLFIVGLNLNLKTLKEVGSVAFLGGLGQVIFTFLIGYMLSLSLGFNNTESAYISMALTFSSTIIVIKLLSDKNDLDSLYGKISAGILLVQDLVVIFILMFISAIDTSDSLVALFSDTLTMGTGFVVLLIITSYYIMPRVVHFMARSQELLFLFSIAWVMLISTIVYRLGFSIEIGALFAGVSLASSPYHHEMSSKVKPLRDFFVVLFFVLLGSQMSIENNMGILVYALIFSLFVLLGKTLIINALMGMLGYHRKVSFSTGLALAQISEFSIILVLVGFNNGVLGQDVLSIITMVGLATIALSAYIFQYSNRIYAKCSAFLKVFERRNLREEFTGRARNFRIILFGYNRIGFSLIRAFRKIKKSFLVVDFNPDVIKLLKNDKSPYKYGDAGDIELLDELSLDKVEMVISTIPDIDTNLLIMGKVRGKNKNAVIIITSHQIDGAFQLYDAGADYVIMPHFLGGMHTSTMIERFGTKVNLFVKEKFRHIEELKLRKGIGHEHPKIH